MLQLAALEGSSSRCDSSAFNWAGLALISHIYRQLRITRLALLSTETKVFPFISDPLWTGCLFWVLQKKLREERPLGRLGSTLVWLRPFLLPMPTLVRGATLWPPLLGALPLLWSDPKLPLRLRAAVPKCRILQMILLISYS